MANQRDAVDVLVTHQRRNSESCLCGWAVLGASHAQHQLDELLASGLVVPAAQLRDLLQRHSSPLSEVQTHTLTLIAGGSSFQDIADQYKSTYPTINWRIQRIHKLYDTHSSTVAVMRALRAGHITLDDINTKWEGSEATTREVQAMQAVADHGTNRAAAAALGWEEHQVKGYLQRAQDKAHAANRVDLIVRAYREGWIQ